MEIKRQTFKRVPPEIQIKDLTPLDITCGSTKCDDGLHCFKSNQRVFKKFGNVGVCKECGIDLIDWQRLFKNDINDAKFTFSMLKKELIRHVYWHAKIDAKAIEKAKKYTQSELRVHARKILKARIGKAKNFREGMQTPKMGDEIVTYAQHATATCCRKCLENWHNIKIGHELTENELNFCTDLVMLFIKDKMK